MYLLSKATSLKTFFTQMLAYYKILRTFASLLKGSTLTKEFWRGGRVVDCGGLENRCAARHPGFESLSLRKTNRTIPDSKQTSPTNSMICGTFFIPLCLP